MSKAPTSPQPVAKDRFAAVVELKELRAARLAEVLTMEAEALLQGIECRKRISFKVAALTKRVEVDYEEKLAALMEESAFDFSFEALNRRIVKERKAPCWCAEVAAPTAATASSTAPTAASQSAAPAKVVLAFPNFLATPAASTTTTATAASTTTTTTNNNNNNNNAASSPQPPAKQPHSAPTAASGGAKYDSILNGKFLSDASVWAPNSILSVQVINLLMSLLIMYVRIPSKRDEGVELLNTMSALTIGGVGAPVIYVEAIIFRFLSLLAFEGGDSSDRSAFVNSQVFRSLPSDLKERVKSTCVSKADEEAAHKHNSGSSQRRSRF